MESFTASVPDSRPKRLRIQNYSLYLFKET